MLSASRHGKCPLATFCFQDVISFGGFATGGASGTQSRLEIRGPGRTVFRSQPGNLWPRIGREIELGKLHDKTLPARSISSCRSRASPHHATIVAYNKILVKQKTWRGRRGPAQPVSRSLVPDPQFSPASTDNHPGAGSATPPESGGEFLTAPLLR